MQILQDMRTTIAGRIPVQYLPPPPRGEGGDTKGGGRVAEWLGGWTCNLEALDSTPALPLCPVGFVSQYRK